MPKTEIYMISELYLNTICHYASCKESMDGKSITYKLGQENGKEHGRMAVARQWIILT